MIVLIIATNREKFPLSPGIPTYLSIGYKFLATVPRMGLMVDDWTRILAKVKCWQPASASHLADRNPMT